MSIVISGGGIIGSILALMLSKLTESKLEISIIEQYSPYWDIDSFVNIPSVIALSKGAYSELVQIDLEPILLNCCSVIDTIEISEYGKFNKVLISALDHQLSELGYVIKLRLFKKELFDLLKKKSSISVYYPTTIKQIKYKTTHNIVILSNGEKIDSKLIIAADGSCSRIAAACGIQWVRRNYQQIAVTAEVITEISHYGKAFERFTPFGPLALLPISKNLSFLIWCIPDRKRKEILEWSEKIFSKKLQNIFGWKLGKFLDIGDRYCYDLWLTYAKNHIAYRLALVGNAAQNLHPIAGQGFNLAIRDAVELSRIIYQALYDHKDIGGYDVLNLYQYRRRFDQYKIIAITDGLIRIFSNSCLPLVIMRNLGLFCVGYSFILKKFLINSILFWNSE